MKSLCLMWIAPASLQPRTFAGSSPVSYNHFGLVKAFLSLLLLLLVSISSPGASAQEKTFGDLGTPLVYNVENTGANYAAPVFPDFAHLPIIRPLPDPFRFASGVRDTGETTRESASGAEWGRSETNPIGAACQRRSQTGPVRAGLRGRRSDVDCVRKSFESAIGEIRRAAKGNGAAGRVRSRTFPAAATDAYGERGALVLRRRVGAGPRSGRHA